MNIANAICVALDTPDIARASGLAAALKGRVGFLKVGMEFFYAHGERGYAEVARHGVPIFLDLKLHDIPNTVSSAMKALTRLDPLPAIVNVHATGGRGMMEAARDAVGGRMKLIAVTILTSLSDEDIAAAGFAPGGTALHAVKLAKLTRAAGLDGVVCSPHDVAAIKAATGREFLTIVPGIRPADTAAGDQKRIATPRSALTAGADILVIGRPITGAADPARAAEMMLHG